MFGVAYARIFPGIALLTPSQETKPHLITAEDVGDEAVTGKAYINGFDREGRPIIVLTPGRENTNTYERQSTHISFGCFWLFLAVSCC